MGLYLTVKYSTCKNLSYIKSGVTQYTRMSSPFVFSVTTMGTLLMLYIEWRQSLTRLTYEFLI